MLLHTVLISFKDPMIFINNPLSEYHSPIDRVNAHKDIYNRYQTLAEECGGEEAGILFWKVDWSLDTRKNVNLVEIAIFKDKDSFQKFREHPKYREIAKKLSKIADWQVGDLEINEIDLLNLKDELSPPTDPYEEIDDHLY